MGKISRWEKFDEWLWDTNWYPWLWDHTYGLFYRSYKRKKFYHQLAEKFGGRIPEVGDTVCTCNYMHGKIVIKRNVDDVIVEDENGKRMGCSLWNCCDPVPHANWQHPSEQEIAQWNEQAQQEIDEYERMNNE